MDLEIPKKEKTQSNLFVRILKRFGLAIFSTLFMLFLSISIILTSFSQPLTNQETVNGWFANEAVYTAIKQNVPKLISEGGEDGEDLGRLVELGEKVFTQEVYFNAVDEALTGTYAWLEGRAGTIEFEIKLASSQDELLEFLDEAFSERLRNLPPCRPGQGIEEITELLGTNCAPRGYSAKDISRALEAAKHDPQFDDFLAHTTIKSSEVLTDDDGSSKITSEATENAQTGYAWLNRAWWMLLIALSVLALLIGLLLGTYQKALSVVGGMLVSGSIFALVGSIYAPKINDLVKGSVASTTDVPTSSHAAASNIVAEIATGPIHDIANVMVFVSGIYLVLGVAMIALSFYLKRKSGKVSTDINQNMTQNTV